MIDFKVVQSTRPLHFAESVEKLLNDDYGIIWIGAVKGEKLTTHVAYMSKEK